MAGRPLALLWRNPRIPLGWGRYPEFSSCPWLNPTPLPVLIPELPVNLAQFSISTRLVAGFTPVSYTHLTLPTILRV